ncbi:MAG: hypothetical protein JWN44_1633 [Myxococcales bacterium]|nr:hypothetical protein [Myxococcales bacterium]
MARLRFDLDGIPLDDEEGRTTAILRFRTTAGLILALPESVDVTVPWSDLAEASVDLSRGKITVRFVDGAGKKHRWLGAATVLSGAWTDRTVLEAPPR